MCVCMCVFGDAGVDVGSRLEQMSRSKVTWGGQRGGLGCVAVVGGQGGWVVRSVRAGKLAKGQVGGWEGWVRVCVCVCVCWGGCEVVGWVWVLEPCHTQ